MSKYDFGSHINIPSETARLVWAAEQREALKARIDAAPKRKPAPACPDCAVTASGADPFANSPGGLMCFWESSPSGDRMRCITKWIDR